GFGGNKIGKAHWRWAFAEAAVRFARHSPRAKQWLARQQQKHGARRALSRLAARLGPAVYPLVRKGAVFDEHGFGRHRERVAATGGRWATGSGGRFRGWALPGID